MVTFCQIISLGPTGQKLIYGQKSAVILVFHLTFTEIGTKTETNVNFSSVKIFCTEKNGSKVCLKKHPCITHY